MNSETNVRTITEPELANNCPPAPVHRFVMPRMVKALTICQPYAHLIVTGQKLVENRSWPTDYRGPLLIHAGKSVKWLSLSDDGLREEEFDIAVCEMAFGSIVGIAELVACLRGSDVRNDRWVRDYPWLKDHEHTEGPWCWVLSHVKHCEPIPHRGSQGLFAVPRDVVRHLESCRRGGPVLARVYSSGEALGERQG